MQAAFPNAVNHEPARGVVRLLLGLVLVAYVALGVGYALRTHDWQAPDEPAHYNYIAQVAARGCCPVIEPGDWDAAYLAELTSARFPAALLGDLEAIQYEDHQPPLYYLLGTVVFRLTDGSLLALRLLSLALGAGVVVCAFAVARVMLPGRPGVALGAAALVAFLPQHLAILASVSNDSLAELVVGLTLLATIVYVKGGRVPAWALGLLVGVGFLTKASAYFMAGVAGLAVLLRWWAARPDRRFGPLLREVALFLVPALALGAVWWLRNVGVYGFPDFLALGAHDRVVVGQLRTDDYITQLGAGEYLRRALATTFDSFWGQFGWMAFRLPDWAYLAIGLLLAVAALGLVLDRLALARRAPAPPGQRLAWVLLALVVVLGLVQYVYYNTEFVQFQGRYLYPALIPFALWLAVGLDAWRRLLPARAGGGLSRAAVWLPLAVLTLLIPLNLFLLWRVIPGLAP